MPQSLLSKSALGDDEVDRRQYSAATLLFPQAAFNISDEITTPTMVTRTTTPATTTER